MNDERQETVDDICQKIRDAGIPELADHILAAWKRERAEIEAQALSIGGIVESSRHTQKPQGNAAALLEALRALRDASRNFYNQILNSKYSGILDKYTCVKQGFPAVLDLRSAFPMANYALSAPASDQELLESPMDLNEQTIHIGDTVHMLNTNHDGDHEWDDVVLSLEYVGKSGGDDWLVHGCEGAAWACECTVLAPAAERKGEGDGE